MTADPMTRLAALHLLDRYHTSQVERRTTYRRAASNELYAMAKVLAAQGVPDARSSPGLITQAVKNAWLRQSTGDYTVVTDEGLRGEFVDVLRTRIASPLCVWEVHAVDDIVAAVNDTILPAEPDTAPNVLTGRSEPGDPVSRVYGHEHVYTELPGPYAGCSCDWSHPDRLDKPGRHGAWVAHVDTLKRANP